jgi:hypothetical protein
VKDLIGIAILIATLFGGTKLLGTIHNQVRKVTLETVKRGLPPLNKMKFKK